MKIPREERFLDVVLAEQDTLARYSTPGLRRNELTRDGKKDQLAGLKITGEEAEKILAALYGPEKKVDTLMPYSVVDDDTTLQVRATITDTDDLANLILTLQNRLIKMERTRDGRNPDAVQSLPAQPDNAARDGGPAAGNPEEEAGTKEGK